MSLELAARGSRELLTVGEKPFSLMGEGGGRGVKKPQPVEILVNFHRLQFNLDRQRTAQSPLNFKIFSRLIEVRGHAKVP